MEAGRVVGLDGPGDVAKGVAQITLRDGERGGVRVEAEGNGASHVDKVALNVVDLLSRQDSDI